MSRKFILALAVGLAAAGAARADDGPKVTLNADEAPDSKPWSEPANFSYTKDKGSKAALSLDLAARLDWGLGADTTDTAFTRAVVHRNTGTGSQVENYAAEFGLHFEPNTAPKNGSAQQFADAYYFFQDVSLAYTYQTNFDDEADGCDAIPKPAKCVRSHVGSARLKWTVQPFQSSWETAESYVKGKATANSPPMAYSFGPVLSVFADDAINAKVDATGVKPKGFVDGVVGTLSLALSPRVFDYRLVFRASVQQTEAFSRSSTRKASFQSSSTLGKVSLDYNLGLKSFEKGPGWSPSIGVSYTKGDDPLGGKVDQQETVVGFKLTYTSP